MALINRDFDFLSKRRITGIISIVAIVISILSLAINSLQLGLDFTSGTIVEVAYSEPVQVNEVSEVLSAAGHDDAEVVAFGSDRDVLIRLPLQEGEREAERANQASDSASLGNEIVTILREDSAGTVELRRSEYVGPAVGAELAERGGMGLLVALGIVMIYVAIRFQSKFALGAVIALAHDVIFTLGIFSLFRINFDLTVLAALLAVIGYSINDTIVVYDRIRENFRTMRKGTPYELINLSINQTLSRTLITSFTTLLVLMAMLIAGGESIQGFAIALTVGVLVGTYSSVYVAANVLIAMGVSKEDLMVPIKEGEELDSMP